MRVCIVTLVVCGALLTASLFSSSLEHALPIDVFWAVLRVAPVGASTSGTFNVIGAYVALPFGGFVDRSFWVLLVVACLTTFATTSVVDTLGPVMSVPMAVATLSRAKVTKNITRVFPDADFDRAFRNAASWVDDFANVFFARGCNFHIAGQAVGVGGIGCSGDCDH